VLDRVTLIVEPAVDLGNRHARTQQAADGRYAQAILIGMRREAVRAGERPREVKAAQSAHGREFVQSNGPGEVAVDVVARPPDAGMKVFGFRGPFNGQLLTAGHSISI
jgi:hypothetical protein